MSGINQNGGDTAMATQAQQFRVNKTREDITISFARFQCLRSIACAAEKWDHSRLKELLKELASMETREMVGVWKQQQ